MDLKIRLDYSEQDMVSLAIDDEFMDIDSNCNKIIGPAEHTEQKKYKLNRNENIGLIFIGSDSGKKYTTVITDHRFVLFGYKTEQICIRWKSTKAISYNEGNLVFKSNNGHKKIIPVRCLVDSNSDIDVTGEMMVSLISSRFNINRK